MHTYINFKILTDSLKFIHFHFEFSNYLFKIKYHIIVKIQNPYSIARNKIYLDTYSDNYIKINKY